ncbi:MAG: hypothetical protein FK734_03680 [Asgard group archaeon]|nr:hypothetical protein [Asgard group archaeon]
MKKTVRTILTISALVFIVSTLTLSTNTLSSYWSVSPGENYNYELTSINIIYDFPPTNYNATGITFDDGFLEEGSTVTLNITSVEEINVSYSLIADGMEENIYMDNETFNAKFYDLMILPLKFASQEVSLNDIKRGFTGIDYILAPSLENTWDIFDGFDSPIYLATIQELFSSVANILAQAQTKLNTTLDECIFDWFVNGTYSDDAQDSFFFTYNLKSAYEISTGLLLGMRTDFSISGMRDGTDLEIILQTEVNREGYTLDEFVLPNDDAFNLGDLLSGLFPGYTWIIVPIALVSLGIKISVRQNKNK